MMRRLLGITVLADFIVSEGVQPVIANLQMAGATAVALNPTVTCEADEYTGKFQPPADAGHSPRAFDRPLFGKKSLWLRSAPSYHPQCEFYADSPYPPRKTNELTEQLGPLIGEFIEACVRENIDVYLQVGAAEPTGLRDEDRPRIPDGTLPKGRIADVASLASPAVRAYNRAYAKDLVNAYPAISGFRIDWPEYPCYTPDEVFQDFGPHAAAWAKAHDFGFEAIRAGVLKFQNDAPGNLTNELLTSFASVDGKAAFRQWVNAFPHVLKWLDLKTALSIDLLQDWRAIIDDLPGETLLSAHAFMPPFSQVTGFDFASAAENCDSISPKFYTMHWCLMVQQWGRWILQRNPSLDESLVTRALVNLLQLSDESPSADVSLDDYAYPTPDQPHPIGVRAQQVKVEEVIKQVSGQSNVFPLVHGYGPLEDFSRRFKIGADANVDGVWVNRYGYLSDEKLAAIARIWNG